MYLGYLITLYYADIVLEQSAKDYNGILLRNQIRRKSRPIFDSYSMEYCKFYCDVLKGLWYILGFIFENQENYTSVFDICPTLK